MQLVLLASFYCQFKINGHVSALSAIDSNIEILNELRVLINDIRFYGEKG